MTINNNIVTVVCPVYNQANFISECLDSLLNQETNFNFNIFVHDDGSTDGTQDIIKDYIHRYPDKIYAVFQTEGQLLKFEGFMKNIILPNISCKYYALCEGDDYWIDKHKLQKQVDFLDDHPDYALCYHAVKKIFHNSTRAPIIIGRSNRTNPQSFEELCHVNYIPSNSVMYRFSCFSEYPGDEQIYPGDWFNHIMIARHGKIGYINEVMSAYRYNEKGISYSETDDEVTTMYCKYAILLINFLKKVDIESSHIYPNYHNEVLIPKFIEIYSANLRKLNFKNINNINTKHTELLQEFKPQICSNSLINNLKKKYSKYKKLYLIELYFIIFILIIFLFYYFS